MAAQLPRPRSRRRSRSPAGARPRPTAQRLWLLLVTGLLAVCGGTAMAAAAPASADGGRWQWPLEGTTQPEPPVARPFQPPPTPWAAGHRGVDLVGTPGQRVRAPAGGTVTHAAPLAGRGVVVITVGELRTTLEPVTPTARRGDEVRAGDVIGRLQGTRSHCLPDSCLHWGVLRNDTYLDPLDRVGANGADIVLLPLTGPPPTAPVSAPGELPADLTGVGPSTAAATAIGFAREHLGDPYVWAATGPASWDCSGLTMAAWGTAGVTLPRNSAAQYAASAPINEAQLRPGDLVFWSVLPGVPTSIYHVGLYIGDGQMIHAPRPGTTVRVESIHAWAAPTFFGRV